MIKFVDGDMFSYLAHIRVNTVNCVGVMGKGIAAQFKERYPDMFQDYKMACGTGGLEPGVIHIWRSLFGEIIVNLPTKRHWRDPSHYSDIDLGLASLRKFLDTQSSVTVTLPALGCGNGGLDWERVKPMIMNRLSGLDPKNILILVFNPRQGG